MTKTIVTTPDCLCVPVVPTFEKWHTEEMSSKKLGVQQYKKFIWKIGHKWSLARNLVQNVIFFIEDVVMIIPNYDNCNSHDFLLHSYYLPF